MTNLNYGDRWRCPFCDTYTLLSEKNLSRATLNVNGASRHGRVGISVQSISCANAECQELAVDVSYGRTSMRQSQARGSWNVIEEKDVLWSRTLLPDGKVVTVPSSVPKEIAITYREAAQIAEVSGRASAAMARRCLQGIVRDFFSTPKDKRGNLGAELSSVKDSIDPELWSSILAVRSIGDIGAHMDHNVDHIIDIAPGEARLLLGLIETLFKEWYEAREKRREATRRLDQLLQEKRAQQKEAKEAGKLTMLEVPDEK